MSEKTMRSKVVRELKAFDAQAIENIAGVGTPDIATSRGWIETKWSRSYPKRAATPVACDHFSPQQRLWHKRHARRGGVSYVLWQIGTDWILLDGDVAAEHIGKASKDELICLARLYLTGGFDRDKLKASLSERFEAIYH